VGQQYQRCYFKSEESNWASTLLFLQAHWPDTLKNLYTDDPIWNMWYLCGIHICAKILTCWSQSRGSLQKYLLSHGMLSTTRIIWKHFSWTLLTREGLTWSSYLVHGLSVLPITFSYTSHYDTRSNHSLFLQVPLSHSNAYFLFLFLWYPLQMEPLPHSVTSSSSTSLDCFKGLFPLLVVLLLK